MAVEYVAEGRQCAEPDGAGAPVLQDGEVGKRDADLVGEAGEGQVALSQKSVKVDFDAVLLLGRHWDQITLSSSVRNAQPCSTTWAKARMTSPSSSHQKWIIQSVSAMALPPDTAVL